MRRARSILILPLLLGLFGACSPQEEAARPEPFALTQEAMGRYCGMNVLEHPGPKSQIILSGALEPIWFSSARDAVAFTLLPEEPKNIGAIYVSDMAAAQSWEEPGARNWIEARGAFYVIGSARRGGMGVAETVPFSTEAAARAFAAAHGGEVVTFDRIPADYVLGDTEAPAPAAPGPQDDGRH
jgi:copper chaperone NosL